MAGEQSATRAEYVARLNRVLDYVEVNLDRDLSLAELASVASFSPFHFHRLFAALVGETLNQFVGRLRLEKAAARLLLDKRRPITAVALDCGFASSATFARAFKQAYGMSATRWRAGGYTQFLAARLSKNGKVARKPGKDVASSAGYASGIRDGAEPSPLQRGRKQVLAEKDVQTAVAELPEMHVAYVRHIGPYKGDAQLFERLWGQLMRWAGPRGLIGPQSKMLCIYHDSPEITEPEKLRLSVCLTVPPQTQVEGEIGKMALPGGKYLQARFELADDQYQAAWDYVYGHWLPDSGYQPDERPSFEMYPQEPAAPEGKRVVVLCVPVKPL
ncbi:MAG: AraC family transcriptional regulator [Chloroflexota bacterium]